ncbi:MAG: metallophosphoesterase [Akkermansiaceae bacterium]
MKHPVLILSDLHLGHKASVLDDVAALEPVLRGAGTVVLNGDTWQELALEFRDDGLRLWRDFQTLCQRLEVDIISLPGNHDPGNCDCDFLALAGGKIIVMHGDAVFPEVAPWSRMAMQKASELRQLIHAHPQDLVEQRFALAREVSRMLVPPTYPRKKNLLARVWDAITPPGRAWLMLRSWATMVSQTRWFAKRYFPSCEIMICGHFHRGGVWERDDLLVINTGSFMPPGGAYWCEWHDEYLRMGQLQKKSGRWNRGEIQGTWKIEAVARR